MKQVLKDGWEYDLVTGWRKVMPKRSGVWKSVKRRLNKRHRKEAKQELRE